MTRTAEAALLSVAIVIATFGAALVGFARGTGLDAQVGLTLIMFLAAFGSIHLALRRWAPSANPFLFPLAAFLTAIGMTEIYRIDPPLANVQRWNLLFAGAAATGVIFALSRAGVSSLRRFQYLFLAGGAMLLLLPLLPDTWPLHGIEINGSRLWVGFDLPGLTTTIRTQPGELAKLCLAVFLASYLADRHVALSTNVDKRGRLSLLTTRQFGPMAIAAVAAFAVLVYQRDIGASLLTLVLLIGSFYLATGAAAYLLGGGVAVVIGGIIAYLNFDHVQRRVAAWLYPFVDFSDTGYRVAQGLFALGAGSLTGSGIGLGRPDLIPTATTDYMYAAVAEEMGLAGAVAVLAAYALLVAVGFGIALHPRDMFRKLLAAGLIFGFATQTILAISGVLRLLPVTGITLPLMSYGGTSLIANMALLAVLAQLSHGART